MRPRLNIALQVPIGIPFTGRPIEEQILGGSESAAWFMAEALRGRGHNVTVFAPGVAQPHLSEGGVRYLPIQMTQKNHPISAFDVVVCSRDYTALEAPIEARLRWYWQHDMPAGDKANQLAYVGAHAHLALTLSEYHTEQMDELRPRSLRKELWDPKARELFWQTSNGVALRRMREATNGLRRHGNRFVYAARAERGLEILLQQIWPHVQYFNPSAELHICNYEWNRVGELAPHFRQVFERCAQLIQGTRNVVMHGALQKREFWKLLASATGYLYPTAYPEVSCIAAMEAMALGTPVVTTADFALTETVAYAGVDGLPHEEEYLKAFCGRAVELMKDEVAWKRYSELGLRHVTAHFQWADVAERWEAKMLEQFETRRDTRGRRIVERLLYTGAVDTARRLAREQGYGELADQGDQICAIAAERGWQRENIAPRQGWESDAGRRPELVRLLPPMRPGRTVRVLHIGAGEGAFLATLLRMREDIVAVGLEELDGPRASAEAFLQEQGWDDRARMVKHLDAKAEAPFDVVLVTDVITQAMAPDVFVGWAEEYGTASALMIFEIPTGPWDSVHFNTKGQLERSHIQNFDEAEILELFGMKDQAIISRNTAGLSPRNEALAYWTIRYTADRKKVSRPIDISRRFLVEAPMERVALSMIVKDGEKSLLACLTSVLPIVDEVSIVIDDRSTDASADPSFALQICAKAKVPARVKRHRFEDFARQRNAALEGVDADWILWMDDDEQMLHRENLPRYLAGGSFWEGYAIRQRHVVFDHPGHPEYDTPTRLFRFNRGWRFYGCVHEDVANPDLGPNSEIQPNLTLDDVDIVHLGFTERKIRLDKSKHRNMELLYKDRRENPERLKGAILVAREQINLATWSIRQGHQLDPKHIDLVRSSCRIFLTAFADEDAPWHRHAEDVYQGALQWLSTFGLEVEPGWGPPFEFSFVGMLSTNGLQGRPLPAPQSRWFASALEMQTYVQRRLDELAAGLQPTVAHRRSVLAARAQDRPGNGHTKPEAADGGGSREEVARLAARFDEQVGRGVLRDGGDQDGRGDAGDDHLARADQGG